MTEKVQIGNKDVWIAVEPLAVHRQNAHIIPTEYFVAYYSTKEPDGDLGEMFKEADNRPKLFLSPVEALEYAYEHLVGKV
jgi:hypothetical protein